MVDVSFKNMISINPEIAQVVSEFSGIGQPTPESPSVLDDTTDAFDRAGMPEPLILEPAAPNASARRFVERDYTHDGQRVLIFQSGAFYSWSGFHYPIVENERLRKEVYGFLETALRPGKGVETVPFQPTKKRSTMLLMRCVRAVS